MVEVDSFAWARRRCLKHIHKLYLFYGCCARCFTFSNSKLKRNTNQIKQVSMLLFKGWNSDWEACETLGLIDGRARFRSHRSAGVHELLAQRVQSRKHPLLDGSERTATFRSVADTTNRAGDLSVSHQRYAADVEIECFVVASFWRLVHHARSILMVKRWKRCNKKWKLRRGSRSMLPRNMFTRSCWKKTATQGSSGLNTTRIYWPPVSSHHKRKGIVL